MLESTYLQQRLRNWRQTSQNRLLGSEQAPDFIDRMGIVTLYPASPEFPNLFSAYVGDPAAKTDSAWDTPSGEIYTWRWTLGRHALAYYSVLVRLRPTWISWPLFPAMLRLCGELRSPHELYQAGKLSAPAYRIVEVLEDASEPLSTGELRALAGFPKGTSSRNLYLKAVAELESQMLLAKIFLGDDHTMYHALVSQRYSEHVSSAERLTRQEAMRAFLLSYLPQAVYIDPNRLAKDLKLPLSDLDTVLADLVGEQRLSPVSLDGKQTGYLWHEPTTINR